MNVNWCWGCFGLTASSVRPVKRYNLLVPNVFPSRQPPLGQPLDPGIQRNIKRLREYVEKNPQRGPKVSRRLARHLRKDLRRSRWGYAVLAAQVYEGLLDSSQPGMADLLAKELIVQRVEKARFLGSRCCEADESVVLDAAAASQRSVICKLLRQQQPELRTAGAELYRRFADHQDTTDYLLQLEALVPHLCTGAAPVAQAAAEADRQPEDVQAAASLSALNAYHDLTTRLSAPAHSFPMAAEALTAHFSAGQHASYLAADGAPVTSDAASKSANPPAAAAVAASQFAEDIGRRTKDVLSAEQTLTTLFEKAQAAGLWQRPESAAPLMSALRRGLDEQHQIYLTFSTLLKFAVKLSTEEQQVVLTVAVELARQLTDAFATAALALLLRTAVQLPPVQAAAAGDILRNSARALAEHCGQVHTLAAATVLLLGLSEAPSPHTHAAVSAAVAAVQPVGLEAARPLLTEAAALLVAEGAVPAQRFTAHALLRQLRLAEPLPEADTVALLSALWHQAASPSSTPQQFADIAATFAWLTGACGAASLTATAAFVGVLWCAAPSATGLLSAISASRRAGVLALHCAAASSLAARAGRAGVSLLPQTDDADAQAVAASLQAASHLRVDGASLIVTNPAGWSVQDEATAAPLLASISAAHVGMPAAAGLKHDKQLSAALQTKFGLLPCTLLLERAQGYMMTATLTETAAADSEPATPRTPVSPAAKVARRSIGPFSGGSPPSAHLNSLGPQSSNPGPHPPSPPTGTSRQTGAVNPTGNVRGAPPAGGLSVEFTTRSRERQQPATQLLQDPAASGTASAAVPAAANAANGVPDADTSQASSAQQASPGAATAGRPGSRASAHPQIPDGSTAGGAIAALDALLAMQGVPQMRRQPPPGLFGTA